MILLVSICADFISLLSTFMSNPNIHHGNFLSFLHIVLIPFRNLYVKKCCRFYRVWSRMKTKQVFFSPVGGRSIGFNDRWLRISWRDQISLNLRLRGETLNTDSNVYVQVTSGRLSQCFFFFYFISIIIIVLIDNCDMLWSMRKE